MSDRHRTKQYRTTHAAYESHRRRQIAYGRWQPFVDAEPVRRHVRSLMGAGLSRRRIPELAGVPDATVGRLLYGKAGKPPSKLIRAEAAEKILRVRATDENLSPRTLVDATGTHRRIQALIANGWPRVKLAEQFDFDRNAVGRCLSRSRVYASTAAAVRDLYDRLWDVPPPENDRWEASAAETARREAARKGWVKPLAWDDSTIDDPSALPWRPLAGQGRSVADPVAVERALNGEALELNPAEIEEVVRIGTAKGMSARKLAEVTGRTGRSVQRRRSQCSKT
jgi:hypothetical protein